MFYVFDIPVLNTPFVERVEMMRKLEEIVIEKGLLEMFHFEYPVTTKGHTSRMELLDKVVDWEGMEGLVHYEPQGLYEFGKRSSNAQKSKKRYDTECKVLQVTKDKSGKGLMHGVASKATGGMPVKFKMKVARRDGTEVENSYESMLELVGKWVTVSYEELSINGVLTKPVGELERLCDEDGNPLE